MTPGFLTAAVWEEDLFVAREILVKISQEHDTTKQLLQTFVIDVLSEVTVARSRTETTLHTGHRVLHNRTARAILTGAQAGELAKVCGELFKNDRDILAAALKLFEKETSSFGPVDPRRPGPSIPSVAPRILALHMMGAVARIGDKPVISSIASALGRCIVPVRMAALRALLRIVPYAWDWDSEDFKARIFKHVSAVCPGKGTQSDISQACRDLLRTRFDYPPS